MFENRYALAGWLAVAQAVIFPIAIIVSVAQGLIGVMVFHHHGPSGLGPGDMLFLLNTGLFVYTYLMFRRLLNERYNFHGLDPLIIINISLSVLIVLGSLFIRTMGIILAPTIVGRPMAFFTIGFAVLSYVTSGIVCVIMAVQLLRAREALNDLIKVLAFVFLAEGIVLISVILTPLYWVLFPVARIIMAMIFLREEKEVEFV